MAHLGISEQLLISWFIKRGFTPYRQYFGYITSGTCWTRNVHHRPVYNARQKLPTLKKKSQCVKGRKSNYVNSGHINAHWKKIEKQILRGSIFSFCLKNLKIIINFENKSRSFQKHFARINMVCFMQNSTKILRAFFFTQVF